MCAWEYNKKTTLLSRKSMEATFYDDAGCGGGFLRKLSIKTAVNT